ncbi:MAG: hypothetical protein ACRD0P_16845 [Stackebrandtia sp.]
MKLGKRSRKLVLFGAAALTLALAGVGGASAMATEINGTNEAISTKYGYITFKHSPESLFARDKRADGYAVMGAIKWDGKVQEFATADGGDESWAKTNFNAPEGKLVAIQLCAVDHPEKKCSKWQYAHA